MDSKRLAVLALLVVVVSPFALAQSTGGGFLGGIANFIGGVVNGIVQTVTNVVNAFTGAANNVVRAVTGGGTSSSNTSAPRISTPNFSATSAPKSGTPVNSSTGTGGTSNASNTYRGATQAAPTHVFTSSTTQTFSEVTLSSLDVQSLLPTGKFFSGMYWQVGINLSNQGPADGPAEVKYYMDCDVQDLFGGNTKNVRVREQPFFKTANIVSGTTDPYYTAFWVDKTVLQYGGTCHFTAQLQNNVTINKKISNFIDGILASVTGTTETRTGSFSGQATTTLTSDIVVEKQVPQLNASVDVGFGGNP